MKRSGVLSGIVAGAGAGLAAGIVAGLLLSIVEVNNRQGDLTWAIALAWGPAVADKLVAGWVVQLVVGVGLGVLFGISFTALKLPLESVAVWALVSGVFWWIVCWFALMPQALRSPPWGPISDAYQLQVIVAGVLAALGYAAVLAAVFAWLEWRWMTN
jgi:hypothetical protein